MYGKLHYVMRENSFTEATTGVCYRMYTYRISELIVCTYLYCLKNENCIINKLLSFLHKEWRKSLIDFNILCFHWSQSLLSWIPIHISPCLTLVDHFSLGRIIGTHPLQLISVCNPLSITMIHGFTPGRNPCQVQTSLAGI